MESTRTNSWFPTTTTAARPAPRAAAAPVSGRVQGPRDRVEVRGSAAVGGNRRRLMETLDLVSLAANPLATLTRRGVELAAVRTGMINPRNDTRLGAYEATQGHARGTVGRGANNSIGAIYMLFGTFGQDRIGDVFHSRQAQDTLRHSVRTEANGRLARTEYNYWRNQQQTQGTAGGVMGSAFSPRVREGIQTVMSAF
jgi:hypothetical protein